MATADTLTKRVADRVAASLVRSNLTKSRAAELSGIPYSTLGRKLNGHVDFTMPELFRLAEATGTKVSEYVPEVAAHAAA